MPDSGVGVMRPRSPQSATALEQRIVEARRKPGVAGARNVQPRMRTLGGFVPRPGTAFAGPRPPRRPPRPQ
jgi:hypothetical protein